MCALVTGVQTCALPIYMKAVGQFSAADVEQFLKPINTFTGLMAAVTAPPVSYFLVALGATATPASGESQRKGESPFLSKVNARQLSAEATWQDGLGYGMSLLDLEAEVRVRWAPSQVVSGESGWKAVQEQQMAGVPVRSEEYTSELQSLMRISSSVVR